jgi:CubicO group peptidase (beta-lactamase class C family)
VVQQFEREREELTATFEKMLEQDPIGGASLALYHRGEKILSLYGGWKDAASTDPWEADTVALLWSASKGVAVSCLLHALQEHQISLNATVTTFWPEFAQAGKEKITIAQLLSHRAGLAALDQNGLSITDHEAIVKALAAQPPNWKYDGSHGYGPKTFDYLVDELLRRITHVASLATYWRTQFADPLGLDLWFGIPKLMLSKTASVIPPKTAPPPSSFGTAYTDHSSLTRRAFLEPGRGFPLLARNKPELQQAAISSNAISSADALAKFYSLLATNDETRYFHSTTRAWMKTPMVSGRDRVLLEELSFSTGFMMNGKLNLFPSRSSFGHPGTGGATAFAIPERELGFAFLPNAIYHVVLSANRTERLMKVFAT